MSVVLAVDGGGFKTHLALVATTARCSRSSAARTAHRTRSACPAASSCSSGCSARRSARRARARRRPAADVAQVMMAGADLPREEEELQAAVDARGWAQRVTVANDTFAILRAGTERGWGVALVCGAGMNCVGVGPDGAHVRWPALGVITGDWGGGYDVGLAGLTPRPGAPMAAGRRPSLERDLPATSAWRRPCRWARRSTSTGSSRSASESSRRSC